MIENLYISNIEQPQGGFAFNGGPLNHIGRCCTLEAGVYVNGKHIILLKEVDYNSHPKIDSLLKKFYKFQESCSQGNIKSMLAFAVTVLCGTALVVSVISLSGTPLLIAAIAATAGICGSITYIIKERIRQMRGMTGSDLMEDLRQAGISKFDAYDTYGLIISRGSSDNGAFHPKEIDYAFYIFQLHLNHEKFKENILLTSTQSKDKFLSWKHEILKRPEFVDLVKVDGKFYSQDFIEAFKALDEVHDDHSEATIGCGIPKIKIGV